MQSAARIVGVFDLDWTRARRKSQLRSLVRTTVANLPHDVYLTFDVDGLDPTARSRAWDVGLWEHALRGATASPEAPPRPSAANEPPAALLAWRPSPREARASGPVTTLTSSATRPAT